MLGLSSSAVAVSDETRVNVAGKIGAFGDLREGLSLRICYEVGPAGRRARAIEMPPSDLACGGVAEADSSDPPREEPVQPVAQPATVPADAPAAALAMPARAASTLPPPVSIERPAPVQAPPRAAAPSKPRPRPVATAPVQAAPARPAPAPGEPPRPRVDPPARSADDYGAVIDWVLRQ
jgi:hypothetical protein